MNFQEDWNMKNYIDTSNKGFSLLELTVVIIIITILASAAIPVLTRDYLNKAGIKTALDISTIQEASRAYFINTGAWPGATSGNPMGDLTGGSYLPSSWSATNPFGNGYSILSNVATLTVSTNIPTAAQPIIQNLLPTNWVSGNVLYSTVTVPGGIIKSFGQPIAVSSGVIYFANTDGFLEGNVWTWADFVSYQILSDSNPNPTTDDGSQGTYSTNNGGPELKVMIHSLVHKGNYYEFIFLAGQGYSVNFIPLNT